MPFTITPAPAAGAFLTTNFKHVGFNGESKNKGNLLYNAGGNFQLAMRAYDALTQAVITTANVTQSYTVTGQKTVASVVGAYPKVGDFLMLRFRREHPVASMAGTFIENEFTILAPASEVIDDETLTINFDPEAIITTAATLPEYLGALITWLEEALTVTVLKVRYEGGWEYIGYVLGSMDTQYDAA